MGRGSKKGRVPANKEDHTGRVFGRWTALSRVEGARPARWLCRCACGLERSVEQKHLKSGESKGCGIGRCRWNYVANSVDAIGKTVEHAAEYTAWYGMKRRCTNPNYPKFANHGGRGITVCPQWINNFWQFLADMGPKPGPDLSLDRINNDGNYEPGNCRWATASQQSMNRRKFKWKKRSARYTSKEKVA